MSRYPVLLGYAGLIPFMVFLGFMIYLRGYPAFLQTAVLFQLFYGGMILSFLGGTHWTQGVVLNNKKQLTLSIMPSIVSLIMTLLALYAGLWITALLVEAALFIVILRADQKWLIREDFPPRYMAFRSKLTAFACFLLLLSALVLI